MLEKQGGNRNPKTLTTPGGNKGLRLAMSAPWLQGCERVQVDGLLNPPCTQLNPLAAVMKEVTRETHLSSDLHSRWRVEGGGILTISPGVHSCGWGKCTSTLPSIAWPPRQLGLPDDLLCVLIKLRFLPVELPPPRSTD